MVVETKRESPVGGSPVYNFEVEGDHSYFVGLTAGGAWVHNQCPYEVGIYNELRETAIAGTEVHHLPQAHLAEQVIPGYDRLTGLAIRLPRGVHRGLPATSRLTGSFTGATAHEVRQLVSHQLRDLYNAGVPRQALKELGKALRESYPSIYTR